MTEAELEIAGQTSPVTDEEKLRAVPWSLSGGVLNTIFASWTFSGSLFLLFLHELGLPAEQIGFVLSLFPFCGVLALGVAPLAARVGCKRVFLAGDGVRKFVMAGLLIVPWMTRACGHGAAVLFVITTISLFALLRAIAETGYYPWLQEFVPNRVRGKYTGASAVLSMVASAVSLLIAGQVVGTGGDLSRFLLLIGVGCVFGLAGVIAMAWVPGGRPLRAEIPGAHLGNMMLALRDRNLVAYLGGLGAVTLGGLFLTSFLPLFVNEKLGVAAGSVVMLDAALMVGCGVSSIVCGWAADRVGSRPVLIPSIGLGLTIPVCWLLIPRQAPHVTAWCAVLYGVYGIVNGGITVTTGRLLFNGVVPPHKSTAYTAIYYAWNGLAGGLAPLMAGKILSVGGRWHGQWGPLTLDAYALLFILGFVMLVTGGILFHLVAPDDRYTTREILLLLVRRGSAARQKEPPGNASHRPGTTLPRAPGRCIAKGIAT